METCLPDSLRPCYAQMVILMGTVSTTFADNREPPCGSMEEPKNGPQCAIRYIVGINTYGSNIGE